MIPETTTLNLQHEANALVASIQNGDPCASYHLGRLIQADVNGALAPFAEALCARILDHVARATEQADIVLADALEDEVYQLVRKAAIDWDGLPCEGRPGEEA